MSWRHTRVSADRTHHVADGRPAYRPRFEEVLAFHAPGLAAVRRAGQAWHIGLDGRPVYARRFARTFGFYEGLAAVTSSDGCHHIRPDGSDLSGDRYTWCGNFQDGRCSVRDRAGSYFHVDLHGRAAYAARWRYAGDYRDGVAVVQADDGRSTHVDREGRLVHDRWFDDLDAFHKGLARARDGTGWTHVDRAGVPVSTRRFAMVEPFYNGLARVETFDGAREVVDESAQTVAVLRPATTSTFHAVSADLVGYWRTAALATAVELGVFDRLPADADRLAARLGMPGDSVRRLLDALGELGYVQREPTGEWRTCAKGTYLARSHAESLADAALEYAGPLHAPWKRLGEILRGAGRRAGDLFRDVASDPARCTSHHRMLRSYARHDCAALVPRLPIAAGEVVFDAAGGTGTLARSIQRAFPRARVLLGDLPELTAVVEVEGIEAVGFDLFDPWPVEADVVVVSRVLHDWPDVDVIRILTRARAALRTGGRLVVIEHLRPDQGFSGALCDLHLLVSCGGRERRRSEWLALLADGGFGASDVIDASGLASAIVAGPW